MKYCPNCGKPSDDNAMFCGECGFSFASAPAPAPAGVQPPQPSYMNEQPQPSYANEQPEPSYAYGQPGAQSGQSYEYGQYGEQPPQGGKKKGGSKVPVLIGVAAAAVCLIVLLAFLLSRLFGGASSTDFVGSQISFAQERAGAWTEGITKDTLSSDITFSASISGNGEMVDVLGDILDDSSVLVKLDSSSGRMLLNAALYLKGSNILEGFLKLTPDEIGFCVPNADETYYVGDFATLAETLGMEIDDTGMNVSMKDVSDDINVIVNRYRDVLSKQITKDKLTIEKNRDVKLSEVGKTVKCTVMTWEPEEDEIIDLIDVLADTLEADEELANLLEVFSAVESGYDSGMDMLAELADTMRDRAEDVAGNVADSGFVWTVALDGKSQITLISVENDIAEIVFERAIESKEGAEAFYVNNDNAETVMITNTFSIDGSKRDGEFTMDSSGGKLSVEYDIDLSKKSVFGIPYGVYTPDFRNIVPGASLELEVTEGKNGSTDHILTVGGLKNLTDDMLSAVDITVNTTNKSSAKEPSGKKEDISDYDMEELMALLEDIGYGVSDALMDSPEIEELMESLYGY